MGILTLGYAAGLVRELVKLPHEMPWLELKRNDASPREIGEYLSALANSAARNTSATARPPNRSGKRRNWSASYGASSIQLPLKNLSPQSEDELLRLID